MLTALKSRPLVDRALLAGAVTSALLLAGAHLFERVGGMVPCELCLDQREAHWTALALAAAGVAASFLFRAPRVAAATVGACALVYLVSAGIAFFHTGVEYKFWEGPAACSASGGVDSITDLGEAFGKKPAGPSCADAPWRFFGMSMAGYNLLISAGLFALTLIAAVAAARDASESRRRAPGRA